MESFEKTRAYLETSSGTYLYYSLAELENEGYTQIDRLPFSIRILLELALRHHLEGKAKAVDVLNLANWQPQQTVRPVMPFYPGAGLNARLQRATGSGGSGCSPICDGPPRRKTTASEPGYPSGCRYRPLGTGGFLWHSGCAGKERSD
jgi:hypothetical protein